MNKIFIILIFFVGMSVSNCDSQPEESESKNVHTTLSAADFEGTVNGKQTGLYTLKNKNGMQVAITNYGGRIVSWMAPGADGEWADIVLGFDSIEGYLNANEVYYGALIGRYGNRIDDGQFSLNGTQYSLATNNGPNHLHGGPGGFHNVVWDAKMLDNQHLALSYISGDDEEGYSGRLNVQVMYILTDDNELKIEYTAVSSEPTVINLTNHAFFNLGGAASGTINNHLLTINADRFTPVDSTLIPTGEMAEVEDTPFDFTEPTPIGERVNEENQQLAHGQGYDHNFVLIKPEQGVLSKAATVHDPESGRVMEIFTTEPGIQFYGGNFMDGSDIGKEGKPYEYRTAFALEPQHFPDSPNQPDFPSTVLRPDSIYHSLSIYRLSTK